MQRVLIVDDNGFSAIYLDHILGERFQVEHVESGSEGVNVALTNPPAVILMDVDMPGMNGYQACRLIKQSPVTHDVPVMFVSACIEPADRLAGYEAGGDDYVTKPFSPEELIHKIEILIGQQKRNRKLAEQAQSAASAALKAMSSMEDGGIIIRFLNEMVSCLDFGAVAEATLRTMAVFGLEVSLQLRDGVESLSRSREGLCSPLEENVLSIMKTCAKVVDLGYKSSFNYPRVSIIVHNMPKGDPEHYERVKSNLTTVVHAIDVHLQSLGLIDGALKRGDTMLRLLQSVLGTLRDIDTRYRTQRVSSSEILNKLVHKIEDSFIHLGLTEGQESFLQETLRGAVDDAQALYDQEIEVDAIMRLLNENLDCALKQEVQALAHDSLQEDSRIELF